MGDRFTNGFIAGLLGGMAASLWGYFSHLINFTTLHLTDYANVLIYGRKMTGFGEMIFAELIQLLFAAAAGVVLAYLLPHLKERYYLFKCMFFGGMIWFIVYAVVLLFKVPQVVVVPLRTAISNLTASLIYGVVLGLTYKWLRKRAREI